MAKKLPSPASMSLPKAKTPLAKLHENIGKLRDLHAAADPHAMSYGPPNLKLPPDVEKAANAVNDHIQGVMSLTQKALTSFRKK